MTYSKGTHELLKRFGLMGLIVMLAAVNVSAVRADSSRNAQPSWHDAVPLARYRNQGDWLVDIGAANPDSVYGPFKTKEYQEGDTERFFALDFDRRGPPRRITAVLRLISEHAYWWFEDGAEVDQNSIAEAAKRFETQIYPMDTMLFGETWTPGIDGDPRIFILHQKKIGSYAVGVFSPKDECPRTLCAGSNQHEMIYIGLDYGPPNSAQQLTVIAHEFQHLIEYNMDGGEQRWLNEGLSQLAEHLNGFNPRYIASSNLRDFLHQPNFQLNSWPLRIAEDPSINYAASYIFCVYLYQRFGTPFIQHLARSPYAGLASVEEALRTMNTGITLDELFEDWAITNYVNSPYVDNGRYYYQSLRLPQRVDTIDLRPGATRRGKVHEYGTEYLQLRGNSTFTLSFQGDTSVPLTDIQPASGDWMWWSFNEEHGASRLEGSFDLSGATDPKLTYNAYWNMPTEYSWANVLVSADGGKKWKVVRATSTKPCRFADSDACYTGTAKDWEAETIDLSDYAGKKIRIRFEYIADSAPPEGGFFIDDIAIDEIGFSDDAETDNATWGAKGFMRMNSDLPQHWAVNVIMRSSPPTVIPLPLDTRNMGKLNITTPDDGAVIVIAAMAPFVNSSASYVVSAK